MSAAQIKAPHPVVVDIARESDAVHAIGRVRVFCLDIGLSNANVAYVTTAAAELASNLWVHTDRGGRLSVRCRLENGRGCLELTAEDDGPGIADVGLALTEGYSTAGGLGCGLPGVARLMDSITIDSQLGSGTRVTARKWY